MTRKRMVLRALAGMAGAAATSLILVGQLGRTHHTLDQFNVFIPLLLPFLALAFAICLRLRDRAGMAMAAIGLAGGGFQLGGATLSGAARDMRGDGPMIKVMTLSTFHANPRPLNLVKVVNDLDPDIALLQETNGTPSMIVGLLLPRHYRLPSCTGMPCSLTILSRWPLRKVKVDLPKHSAHPDLVMADVAAPFGTLRVGDVHLKRPYVQGAQDVLMATAAIARANSGGPLILGGDFNAATATFGLARFAQASGLRRQDGFVPTYPANRPLPAFTGIDHIYANGHWSRMGCRRTAAGGSDHYGVLCRLRWRAR